MPYAPNKKDAFSKNRIRGKKDRENFLQLFDRTCHKIYFYSFECGKNRADADAIIRDSFIYMYEHVAELRSWPSLDEWQQDCVQIAFRQLLRSQLLAMTEDGADISASSRLSESKKEELWNNIIKMSDIDPWRMIPVPGKSSIFSVIADQTMSDLRYMTVGDIIKSAAMIVGIIAVAIAAVVFGVDYINGLRTGQVEAMQEIFLDDRSYAEYDLTANETVDLAEVARLLDEATKLDVDDEGKQLNVTAPKSIGNTESAAVYTEDIEINAALIDIINAVIDDDMSDFEKLEELYEYLGSNIVYAEYTGSGTDELSVLRDYFENKSGTSLHYSTVLAALYRAAGYDCDVVSGSFILNRDTEFERAVKHYWNRMHINGIVYYLDLEADCASDGTEVRKYYFMAADGNARWLLFERDHKMQ